MKFTEVTGDLFSAPKDCYLVHCISADYALGAGIAKKFEELYGMRAKLFRLYPRQAGRDSIGTALLVDNVFNLVTKEKYYHKPTYWCLKESLLDLKKQCEERHIMNLAMPRIGCGLDRLAWPTVTAFLKSVFADTDVEITVYILGRESGV